MRLALLVLVAACTAPAASDAPPTDEAGVDTEPVDSADPVDTEPAVDSDTGAPHTDADPPLEPGAPFAVAVHSFTPGAFAGFGADKLPDIVLGAPDGKGAAAGSLHVLSLGEGGDVVLQLGAGVIDGPGTDLLVFENAFRGWQETGLVAVSEDAEAWHTWPCDTTTRVGCAGVQPVEAIRTNGVDPTDPETAGGDAFDLAQLDLPQGFVGRFVRVTDSGANDLDGLGYGGTSGGFDLDAVAVVNAAP